MADCASPPDPIDPKTAGHAQQAIGLPHVAITGASSGIGAALAAAYAARGAHLFLTARNEKRLAQVASQCSERGAGKGGSVATAVVDVADTHEVAALLHAADGQRSIDILIVNAGLGGADSLVKDGLEAPAHALAIAAVNFVGAVATVMALGDRFVARRRGHIVLISSVASKVPLPMAPTYAGSKAGVSAYARSLRLALQHHGVAVTLVEPGFVRTPMSEGLPGPKPFTVSADDAARRIMAAIDRRVARIVFPLPMRLLIALARCIPDAMIGLLLRRTGRP